MRAHHVIAVFALLAAGSAQANSSTYTKLDPDHCTKLSSHEAGVTLKCPGYRSYPVYLADDDARESLRYGPAAKDLIEKSFESFSEFNSVNLTVEWRLNDKGRPIAAIQRWFIENADPATGAPAPGLKGQVLVVSRVAQDDDGLSCVIGYIDALANPDANDLARKLADETARDFACGYTQAVWEGARGPKSGSPSSSLPDRLKVE